ncbi:hypothetical protein M758_10G109300 [Ceratodon purpureus]|nr:hypothetical protein M758_10G109300 [Ceratodon purpureus]
MNFLHHVDCNSTSDIESESTWRIVVTECNLHWSRRCYETNSVAFSFPICY